MRATSRDGSVLIRFRAFDGRTKSATASLPLAWWSVARLRGIGAVMESKGLEERRQSLEEEFFHKANERLRDALKAKKDRESAKQALHAAGVPEGGPGSQLLHQWLSTPPPATLEGTWTQYVRELCAQMTPDAKGKLCSELLGRTLRIAKSAGGFLGIGAVSAAEQQVIDRLTEAFSVG